MPFFAKAILTFSMKTLLVLLTASMCLLHEVRSSPSPFVVLSALSVPAVPAAGAKILLDYERTRIRFMRNIGGPNQEEYSSIGGETIPNIEKDVKEMKKDIKDMKDRFEILEEKCSKDGLQNSTNYYCPPGTSSPSGLYPGKCL